MARIHLRGITKCFGPGQAAVRSADLDIEDGEFVVIVGPSGCGKTTLLRMIAGLEAPTSGAILLDGRDITREAPARRDIAMVFQNYALYPHMSVRQNLAFALRIRKVSREEIDRRVRDVADLMGLSEVLDRRPAQLSGGQRQRVAVGRAIVREPSAFLFDEPLSNLDALLRSRMRQELKALHQRLRTTAVYVTHDQEEAMSLADRVVVMAQGEIQQVDHPMRVYAEPANRFVASFIGTPAMNILDGAVRLEGSDVLFERSSRRGTLRIPLDHGFLPVLQDGVSIAVGVRPSDLAVVDEPSPGSVPLTCDLVETFGPHADLTCSAADGSTFVIRTDRLDIARGQLLHVRPRRVHVFEAGAFGRAIQPVREQSQAARSTPAPVSETST